MTAHEIKCWNHH